MSKSVIKRINELSENFFKNVIEEKTSAEKKSSIFGDNYGAEKNKNNPGSISGILQNNSEKDKKDKEIQKQINDAKQKKSKNEQNIRTSEQNISKTDNSIKSTKSEIVSLKGKLAELHEPQQSEYMITETNKNGEEVPVVDEAAYTAAHDAYLIEKANLENQIEQKEQELQDLEDALNTTKNELTSLKQEQASIDSEISSLETEQQQASMEEAPEEQENNKIQEEKAEDKAKEEEQKEELDNVRNNANDTLFKLEQEAANAKVMLNGSINLFSSGTDEIVSSLDSFADNLTDSISEQENENKDESNEDDNKADEGISQEILKNAQKIYINKLLKKASDEGINPVNLPVEDKERYMERDNAYKEQYYKNISDFVSKYSRNPNDKEMNNFLQQAIEEVDKQTENTFNNKTNTPDNSNENALKTGSYGPLNSAFLMIAQKKKEEAASTPSTDSSSQSKTENLISDLKKISAAETTQSTFNPITNYILSNNEFFSDTSDEGKKRILHNYEVMQRNFDENKNATNSEEKATDALEEVLVPIVAACTVSICMQGISMVKDAQADEKTKQKADEIMEEAKKTFINKIAEKDAEGGIDRSSLSEEETAKYLERDKAYEDYYYKLIVDFVDANGGRNPTEEEFEALLNQAIEEIDKMNEEEQREYNKTAEGMSNEEWERTTKNPGGVVNLIRAGKSAPEIIKIYRTPALFNNIDQVIELSNFGFSLDQITAIVNNPNYSNEMPNIFRLAETGRNLSEIMDLINNPNCRKSMAHVIKLAEMGISTSEITKIMNNSNCRMNLNQTVELVALGKNSNEINDLFNDPNCVGNLDIVINFAKMDIPAANIIGMLNDSNIKNAINGNDILAGINNNSNNINTPSDKNNIEDNFKEKETENGDNKDNENFFNTYNSIISGMEFNNVKEKDVFKIISGDVSVNQINKSISGSSDNNMDIFELEFFKKRIQK